MQHRHRQSRKLYVKSSNGFVSRFLQPEQHILGEAIVADYSATSQMLQGRIDQTIKTTK